MLCRKCGQAVQDGERFCRACGEPVVITKKEEFNPATAFKTAASFAPAGDLGEATENNALATTPPNKSGTTVRGFHRADSLSGDEKVTVPEPDNIGVDKSFIKKAKPKGSGLDLVQFTRSPRIMHEVPAGVIEIASPPAAGTKPEINWLATFLPTVVTLGIAVVMTAVLGSPMMLLYTLPMTIAGVVVSITNYRKQTKKYNEQIEVRQRKYDAHIASVVGEIERKKKGQLTAMLLADPSTEECLEIAKDRLPRLWERTPDDPDFLSVRVGSGPVDFSVKIDVPKESLSLDEDSLRNKPREIKERYKTVEGAPITFSLYREQICGVVGAKQDTRALIKNLIVQLTTHHSYTEMKTVCIYNPNDEAELRWIKDLPHSKDTDRKSSFVASSKEEAKELFRHFSEVFKQRKLAAISNASYGQAPTYLPYYLFIILEPTFLEKNDPINEFLFMSRDLGIGCLMAVQDVAHLPKECKELIVLGGKRGQLFNSDHASTKQAFELDSFSGTNYAVFGRSMKPLCCDEGLAQNSLPVSYSFYEMLGLSNIDEFDIRKTWRMSNVVKSLAAPIGIAENGKTLYLDLHEKAHGPHGLVAGTTGSGKSELLQSYILSMALNYHPYEVSFVIIDFKGGGMASQVAGLPHLIGTITNIDDQELTRSLSSIEAELHRRQKIIKEYNDGHTDKVKDIYDYIERYKAGLASLPLPHLIIIVDEFAELRAEQPEFMKKLISAARIGRSLGVHLILATQKPAGQVDEQIWSNTSFQLCLKVASASDSKEVIKSDLAYQITEPGRAYLRVGNNVVFELFQSGYSGEKVYTRNGVNLTQMQEAIGYIKEHCETNNIKKLPDICLPPLSSEIEFPEAADTSSAELLPIGMYDDPENQYQGQFRVDVFSKNTMIIGAARSGKTNILQSLIRSVADRYSPSEVNIYIIDFASMILKSLETLNHVGGVVTPTEDEKFKNLIKLLYSEIEIRKKKFFELGVSSYTAYRDAGKTDLPRIVLFIDNFTALRELYLMDTDPIQTICQNGITYGISVVVANSQTSGISYQYLSNFSTRIALYCNNSTEYHVLFEKCNLKLHDIPGRGIVEANNKFYHCQMYRSFNGEKEVDQAKEIKEYISSQMKKYGTLRAKPIPEIPETLFANTFVSTSSSLTENSFCVAVGLDYESVAPVLVDFKSIGTFVVSGRPHFGRNNFLRYLICAAEEMHHSKTEFFIIDGIDRKLNDVKTCPNVSKYTFLPDEALQVVRDVEAAVSARYTEVVSGKVELLSNSPVIVMMINSLDAIEAICNNPATLAAYNNIIGKFKNMNVCVILGGVENTNIPYNAPEILKKAKEDRKVFLFDDIENLKLFDLPYGSTKNYKKPLELGDCYFIKGNECVKLKTPKC